VTLADVSIDVAGFVADKWTSYITPHGILQANGKVPRGPMEGCHVAPVYWFLVECLV
jgi:hypothetical protein